MNTNEREKLGISFHRTLPLRRAGITQLLRVLQDSESDLDYTEIWKNTNLGTVDAQATSRYAVGLGLYDKFGITSFGRFVVDHDIELNHLPTQWLLHYYMVAPQHRGPLYWKHLTEVVLMMNAVLTSEVLSTIVENFDLASGSKPLKRDTYRSAAVAFLNTYGKSDGLSALNILKEADSSGYIAQDVEPAPWPVVAYALADTWDTAWDKRLTVNLDQVREVGASLMMGMGTLMTKLRPMQERGWIEIHRSIPPYQITRHFDHATSLLEHLYERDDE